MASLESAGELAIYGGSPAVRVADDRENVDSGSQVMASYMALKHGWRDEQGQLEPVPFKGECCCARKNQTDLSECSTDFLGRDLSMSRRFSLG